MPIDRRPDRRDEAQYSRFADLAKRDPNKYHYAIMPVIICASFSRKFKICIAVATNVTPGDVPTTYQCGYQTHSRGRKKQNPLSCINHVTPTRLIPLSTHDIPLSFQLSCMVSI